MKILIHLGHPAHFHLYKNSLLSLRSNNEIIVAIKNKDVLEQLLVNAGIEYVNIWKKGKRNITFLNTFGQIKQEFNLLRIALKFKPDLITGSSVAVTHVAKLMNLPSLYLGEDDAEVVPKASRLSLPFATIILSPVVCSKGKWEYKKIAYQSYHELAYLHPNHFQADKDIVEKYFSSIKPYVIIRFAKLNAHHDKGIQGINTEIAQKLIDILKPHGDIYITSERELEPQFEQYRIKINPLHMHHVMAFAELYIGDSQTMAAEAGVLGVPFVRFNDFVGRIGYLRELEEYYQLGFGIKSNEVERLYEVVEELINLPNRKEIYSKRRLKMLSEKIDYAKFLTWFIENYPNSKQIMNDNPDYQYIFK